MSKTLAALLRKSKSAYRDLWVAQSREQFATEPKDEVIDRHLAYWDAIVRAADTEIYDELITMARQTGEYQYSEGLDVSTAIQRTVEATNVIEIALLESNAGDASPLDVITEIADLRSMLVMAVVAGYNDAIAQAEKSNPLSTRQHLRAALLADPKRFPAIELAAREEIRPLYDENLRAYVVLSGKLRIYNLLPNGRSVTLSIASADELFLQWPSTGSSLSCICAEAVERSRVIAMSERDLMQLLIANPAEALYAVTSFARRLAESSVLIKDLMDNSVNLRLYRTLLELAREFGKSDNGGVLIDMPLTHQRLAEMVGSNRVTVTRKLLELQKRGLIAGRGSGSIEIRDLDGLARLIGHPQS